ncbi:MAG: ribonuclease R [Candidatus Binatia bacterium]
MGVFDLSPSILYPRFSILDPNMTSVKDKILAFFAARPRHRFKPAEIQRKIGENSRELHAVLEALRQLTKEGRLVRSKGNHYGLPEGRNIITGKVHAHPDGYGFLIPEDKNKEDVYLSRREMRRVMHGDRALVRVETKKHGHGTEAHVVQILERGQKRIVGTFEEADGRGLIVPMDPRVAPIPLTPKGVKPARGKVIAVEIQRYGGGYSQPEGKIDRVLGDPDNPEVQAQSIIYRFGLPTDFSPEALEETSRTPPIVGAEELKGRTDLRALPTVTIDGETARDFDDAVSIEKRDGRYVLYVSIADVARYVRRGTPLDQEAYGRGTSVYFPDRALPMLPVELSNGICSLNPGVDRLTKTVRLTIDSKGAVEESEFFDSVIRSQERMTYTDVRRILVDRESERLERYRGLVERFKLMEDLALVLQESRRHRGSLDFDLPEADIVLDLQGVPENIVRSERNIAHRMIEEFMIAANEAVARRLKELDLPLLYRVHEGPDEETLRAIAPFLLSLGYRLALKKDQTSPKEIQRVLARARGKPEERILNRVILRAMKQARYSPENIGHYGLASACYAHFTSPIRRYPDLIVHRVLDDALEGRKLKSSEKEDLLRYLEEAGKHTSQRERIAMDAEREMVALKKSQFMIGKIGEEFSGYIMSLAPFGFFVELEAYFVEGLVRLASLEDDSYQYYEKEQIIKGRRHGRTFRLGDRVHVRVNRVNAFRSEIDFELVGGLSPGAV